MLRHKPSFRKIQLVYVYKSFYKKAYGDSKENDMQVFNKKKQESHLAKPLFWLAISFLTLQLSL